MEISKYVCNELTITHHTEPTGNGIKSVVTVEYASGNKTDYYRGNDTERAKRSYTEMVQLINRMK